MKEGKKPEYSGKPLATSFRKYHILKPNDSSPQRDSNPHSCIGGRLGNADVLTVTTMSRPQTNKSKYPI